MHPKRWMRNLVVEFFKVSALLFLVNSMSTRQQIGILVQN